jgi:hypothetical protein
MTLIFLGCYSAQAKVLKTWGELKLFLPASKGLQ